MLDVIDEIRKTDVAKMCSHRMVAEYMMNH